VVAIGRRRPRPGSITEIRLPLRYTGSMNAWLLGGEPLTLVDPGPRNDEALCALERGLRRRGVRVEHIELVLATHQHVDHVGLVETVCRRSGAQVAVVSGLARFGADFEARLASDRAFSAELMAAHGVPREVIAEGAELWDFIAANGERFQTDRRLAEGDRVRAGGRDLRVVPRPGHSATDTLLVDEAGGVAFAGDHLLATISSNTEIDPQRPRSRAEYLQSLRRTAAMPLRRLLTGHGTEITRHAELIRSRIVEHAARSDRVVHVLGAGPATAYEIAGHLWSAETVRSQPLLVVWEVLGHLDLLHGAGAVVERVEADRHTFALRGDALEARTRSRLALRR
jgi:glyoxylase-like metal-dependent hydrolase (beta-lactamase superfamily II)